MKRLIGHLYFWVLLAIMSGGIFGYVDPAAAVKLKPLGDGFIKLVRMLISPVIFCTVVLGIAGAGNMKKVGGVGGTALIYFEVVSTFALVIGLVVVSVVGAGGAMAFTIGRYGIAALRPLALVMGSFYLTCFLFIFIVLGSIARWTGFNILRFIGYINTELLTVFGTSSSESALVPLMQKLEALGCPKSVVGLVVPSGYF